MSAQTGYPIVLAHGIARFDALSDLLNAELTQLVGQSLVDHALHFLNGFGIQLHQDSIEYFKGIASFLEGKDFTVYAPRVSFGAGVQKRSEDLRGAINGILAGGNGKVHIIAHSMGGLDARHMIVDLGMAASVASLTTIGTPHLGSSFADWLVEHQADALRDVAARIIDLGGLDDLTTGACRQYNDDPRVVAAEAANGVIYRAYWCREDYQEVFAPLKPSWVIIHDREQQDNDGLVSISSQMWQPQRDDGAGHVNQIDQIEFSVPADHLNEVGWWDPDELAAGPARLDILDAKRTYEQQIRQIYLDIAQGLRD